jgi:hypothetical protein
MKEERATAEARRPVGARLARPKGGAVVDDPYADLLAASDPDVLRESLAAHADDLRQAATGHHAGPMVAVRTVAHRGHEIVIRTSYQITVDGQPFDAHVTVDNAGRVHYHGLPTRDFESTVDLVKKVVDYFPDDFGGDTRPAPTNGHDGHGEHDHAGHDHEGGH